MDFDESDTPPPTLFDPVRETDPRARQWAQREVEYVTERDRLREEVRSLRRKLGQVVLECQQLRRQLHPAAEKDQEVK